MVTNKTWQITFRSELLKAQPVGTEDDIIREIDMQIADLKQIILCLQLHQKSKRNKTLKDVHSIIKLIDPKAPLGENRIVSKLITYQHETPNIDANGTGASDLPPNRI